MSLLVNFSQAPIWLAGFTQCPEVF